MSARSRRTAGLHGVTKLRKFLRKAGKHNGELTKGLIKTLDLQAEETVFVMQRNAPVDDGDLIRSIDMVASNDRLTQVIGPGVKGTTTAKKRTGSRFGTQRIGVSGKKVNFSAQTNFDRFQYMKAYWLEKGTKKMRAHRFIEPTWNSMKGRAASALRKSVKDTLRRLVRSS